MQNAAASLHLPLQHPAPIHQLQPTASSTAHHSLKICTFNANGIYGRERDLLDFLQTNNIAVALIQEPRLFINQPPKLYRCTLLVEHSVPGYRGLITSISPAWSHATIIPDLRFTSKYYFFVRINTARLPVYICNIYLPSSHLEANEVQATIANLTTGECHTTC
jgi:exonuclease III